MVRLTDFSIVDTGHSSTNPIKSACPFDFVQHNKKNLVVTVGDSWTWGKDITPNDDDTARLTSHYGSLLAHDLDADWLNLGQCGAGNFWIADKVDEVASQIPKLQYDAIYVVCTFTEVGRSANSRQDIDFYRFLQTHPAEELLSYLNQLCVDRISQALLPFAHVTLRVGTNFVEHCGLNTPYLIPRTWLELMAEQYSIVIPEPCYVVASWVFDELNNLADLAPDRAQYIEWLEGMLQPAIDRANLLRSIPIMTNTVRPTTLHRNNGHPNAQGHAMWAQYILKTLK